ncbi:hypothetical protein [Rhodovulum visakhapatnamense]|uniref:Uncharacterized protein n=1 Tax=Rhodovulum visakhapatnamense TaxID=364297 RepID=A0A4V3GV25_9RHOB|nr:hypothetical protein [Rhodovulum visakhapatnamense]TDX33202.1 hypothetical protein EV657_10277 [Rhodovulum visakhapatnamense]
MNLPQIFYAVILFGAFLGGTAGIDAWVILVIAAFAVVATVFDPAAKAKRTAEGKTLTKALPMIVVNQVIWANLAFLIGLGLAWPFGGSILALPLLVPLIVSGIGCAGALAVGMKPGAKG